MDEESVKLLSEEVSRCVLRDRLLRILIMNCLSGSDAQGIRRETQGRRQRRIRIQKLQPGYRAVRESHSLQAGPGVLLEPCGVLQCPVSMGKGS